MNLSKLFEKSDEKEFTTFPRTLESYEGYKPVLIFIIGAIITLALSTVILIPLGKQSQDSVMNIITTAITVILMIPGLYIATRLMYKIPFSTQIAPIRKWTWGIYIKSLVITVAVYAIIGGIEILFSGKSIANKFTIVTFLLCLILPIFQGFAEEYLCRGFLMQSLGSWIKIPILAIILQATIFTGMHSYNQIALISVLCTGLIYGFLTWYGQGLEASSAMHAANNIFAFLTVGFGLQESISGDSSAIGLLINLVLMITPVVILIILDKKYDWGLKTDVN